VRTNIVIDDKLMADVMAYGDFKTKREAVEEGLRTRKLMLEPAGMAGSI
jgi:Arc/MetJ family transcription regulator